LDSKKAAGEMEFNHLKGVGRRGDLEGGLFSGAEIEVERNAGGKRALGRIGLRWRGARGCEGEQEKKGRATWPDAHCGSPAPELG
jgi:hypothetical protein